MGELAVDARDRGRITIVAGGADKYVIARSRATVAARGSVIVTAQVFAGTAEITTAGKRRVVEAGEVWTPAEPVAPEHSHALACWLRNRVERGGTSQVAANASRPLDHGDQRRERAYLRAGSRFSTS